MTNFRRASTHKGDIMRNRSFALFFVAALSGCATVSNTPLSQQASEQLRNKTLTVVNYPAADFSAFTAGKAMFGLIGAAEMTAAGNKIVKEDQIPDPDIRIGHELAQRLASERNMRVIAIDKVAANDSPSTLASTYPGADLLLDVKTLSWMFVYYPSDWSHYKVIYSARVRLIDTASKDILAETACKTVQGDDKHPPTREQLLDDHGALLKDYLNKGADACVNVLAKNLLRL
jgi:hypothetical protein